MKPVETKHHHHFILYDADVFSGFLSQQFDVDYHLAQKTLLDQAHGRGAAHFLQLEGKEEKVYGVLRHYRRGGMIAKLLYDRYWWQGLEQTRAWQEWKLLKTLCHWQLPVPQPLAAHVYRQGMFYRADIITRCIDDSHTLSRHLSREAFSEQQWQQLGQLVALFHAKGVYHSDLNAHNILLTRSGQLYLIDFDKGALKSRASQWQQEVVARLKRSLLKLSSQDSGFHFGEDDWQHFLQGYDAGK